MVDEAFNEKLLTEKLSKLNSSQQSIESLSRWCISHRRKAKQVVETWEKVFKSAQREQRVSFLYLSNDILQNSRRKGSEFVNEFWKVLPAALKGVYDSGDENCRKVASRLVDIWEERKVFGSRGQNLKNEILGNNPSPINNGKNSNPIKVVKRDATSLRIKLAVGGLPEKIVTALQLVHDEAVSEEAALNKCRNAVSCVQEIEKDVVNASSQGNLHGSDVLDNIQKQENIIQQCISELENCEAVRVALVSQLGEALQDQESKLEQIRNELLVARGHIEQAANMRLQLTSTSSVPPTMSQPMMEPAFTPVLPPINMTLPPPVHPVTSFANSNEEESKKATAAAVAAKLAASTSSAQMLTSILSSLVAEEAASMSSGLKRPKLEPPMVFPDAKNSEGANPAYFPTSQQAMTNMPPVQSASTQPLSQLQSPFLPPPPPPPPLAPPATSPANQLVQSNMTGLPYGYGASNLLPQPPSSNAALGFPRPGPAPQQTQQNQQQQPLQPPASGGYYRPVGIGFYGQSHQPSTPPINRQ
ncbi:regulation of nuclear pre-mRNA domain-containing protein 1B [Sesamum indicum]|uniref:regulation of Nuclear Pre-mRNA domain-containing protein 1B n=1 Tax=Sesamum indicum TaxID=4182 RepID=A0A6I9T5I4_SESIN|nr:regulation of nuclear pre-mRNA domain-containing protein 1B [Sesamum indicum]XP_011079147.1 regulation of nuclear pre-mRNA domain-containing protein 1B [Sesamum indicum]XP_011079148.1 regulation of nuclear pre-mRNA domain-containing protein 1B [Sesamum indicum]